MLSFVESEMTFGPYQDDHCFRVEKSQFYRSIAANVKIAEFLLLRLAVDSASIWIVEAKSSSPNPRTEPNFREYISEIKEKLTNALVLCVASILKREPGAAAELPEPFKPLNLTTLRFRLILVLKDHPMGSLAPLQDALRVALNPTVKTWALGEPAVVVMNREIALRQRLITNN